MRRLAALLAFVSGFLLGARVDYEWWVYETDDAADRSPA